jgi:hypothetical protein
VRSHQNRSGIMARKKKEVPAEQTEISTDVPDGIRLLELTIQNFRGLRFAHVKLDDEGRLIPVTGKNKAGKTSLLMAILSLVHGAKEAPENPINDQAAEGEKSFVRGKFSNGFTVEERFTDRGRYLTVVSQDGGAYKQGALNEWIEGVSGDPIHLWSLRKDRLLNVLLQTTTEPEADAKLIEYDEAEKRIRDERTPHNSTIQKIQRMEAPEGERPEPVDLMALFSRSQELEKEANEYRRMQEDYENAGDAADQAERNILDLKAKVAEWEERKNQAQALMGRVAGIIKNTVDPKIEKEAVAAEIRRAESQEESLTEWRRWDDSQADLAKAKEEAERLTADLQEVQKQKAGYIAGIESKVDGLTFTLPPEGSQIEPMLHGRGLYAASGAERALFQIDTLFALNPNLKVILLPDEGDAFDADYLKKIDEESRKRGFQTWICRIQEGLEGEIKIVDGRTVERDADHE